MDAEDKIEVPSTGGAVCSANGNSRELMSSPMTCMLAAFGFAGMTTWGIYAIFSPALPILDAFGETTAVTCLFLSKLAEIALLAFMLVRPNWIIKAVRRAALPAAFVLTMPAFAIALLTGGQLSERLSLLAEAAWVLVGLGDALLCFGWLVILTRMPTRWSSLAIAAGGAVATPLFLLIADARDSGIGLAGMMLLLFASCAAAAYLLKSTDKALIEEIEDFEVGPLPGVRESAFVATSSAAYGFLVIMLCLGGTAAVVTAALASLAASALAIVWAMQRVEKRWETNAVQHMVTPVLVAAILLVPQLDQAGQTICGAVVVATFAYSSLMKWTEMAVAGYEFQLHPVKSTALERIMQWGGLVVGGAISFAVFHGRLAAPEELSLIATVIVIAVVAAFALLEAGTVSRLAPTPITVADDEPIAAIEEDEAPKASAPFRERCEALAKQYELTERESEVFVLLAKGRNTEHIQKTLFISANTAKTHILHIYRKMAINSQQSLIDEVDKRHEAEG